MSTRRNIAFFLSIVLGSTGTFSQQKSLREAASRGDAERGRYIAHHVAMCVQCHTPRGADGQLLLDRAFEGAPIPVSKPPQWSAWAEFAPRIAGLPQYTEEQMVTLLTTGVGREGKPLRSPMPSFRLTRQDAADVTAYLKSLR